MTSLCLSFVFQHWAGSVSCSSLILYMLFCVSSECVCVCLHTCVCVFACMLAPLQVQTSNVFGGRLHFFNIFFPFPSCFAFSSWMLFLVWCVSSSVSLSWGSLDILDFEIWICFTASSRTACHFYNAIHQGNDDKFSECRLAISKSDFYMTH